MSAELTFVKYCPLCGAENPRQQAFCLECLDGDLSTVPVEARRKKATAPPAKPVAAEAPATEASAAETPAVEPATMRVAPTPRCILELLDI